jgi:dolichol-phosphate mannosyltransferase
MAAETQPMSASSRELTIVIPTFQERDNVGPLVRLVREALPTISWEMIFVDDNSRDGTAEAVWEIGRSDPRVRCIKRIGRRGLSSACIEGMLATGATYVAVMDADLQHDPILLRSMLDILRRDQVDLVIASRYVPGGSVGDWEVNRVRISTFATRLSRLITKQPVSDPMSGYFMLRREVLESEVERLSSLGFKILLDIIASSPTPLRLAEVPLQFGKRYAGESKLSTAVAWEFLLLIGDKLFGRYVPVRFVAFGSVGAAGAFVHFAVLTAAFKGIGLSFPVSQAAAAIIAMIFNYGVNNVLTYGDVSRKGWDWLRGLASFMVVCGLGAVTNVGVASYLFGQRQTMWALAAIAGIFVGAVWNYAVSSRYTWGK